MVLYPGALATAPTTSSTSYLVWKVGVYTSDGDHAESDDPCMYQTSIVKRGSASFRCVSGVVHQWHLQQGHCLMNWWKPRLSLYIQSGAAFPHSIRPQNYPIGILGRVHWYTLPELLFLRVFASSSAQLPPEQWRRTTTWAFYKDLEEIAIFRFGFLLKNCIVLILLCY